MIARILMMVTGCLAALALSTPAYASENWNPDQVVVMDLHEDFMTSADEDLLAELGARPGDVLDVTYSHDGAPCAYQAPQCPLVDGIPLPPSSALFTPAGPDSEEGSTYPAYSGLFEMKSFRFGGFIDAYVDNPQETETAAKNTPDGMYWVSDERVGDDGAEYVRIGWGINDIWLDTARLAPVQMPSGGPEVPVEHSPEDFESTEVIPVEHGDPAQAQDAEATDEEAVKRDESGLGSTVWVVGGVAVAAAAWGLRRRRVLGGEA